MLAMPFFIEPVSTGADPTHLLGRISHHQSVIRYVTGHNRAGPDEGVSADPVAAYDGAISAQGGALLNQGGADFFLAYDMRPGIDDIRENHARAAEDVLFQGDARVNGYVVLNLASVPDGHIRSDHHVLPDVAGFSDHAAV